MNTTARVTVEIDTALLRRYSDTYLASLWHVAQANPAPAFDTPHAGELAERIGREIIRRWLHATEPELYDHQGHHYYWEQLRHLGTWNTDRVFVPRAPGAEADGEAATGDAR
jgi:hypothetical protein